MTERKHIRGKHPGNTVVHAREYVGGFVQGDAKHSLVVKLKTHGGCCLMLYYAERFNMNHQNFYAIELDQQQRRDLQAFLATCPDFPWIEEVPAGAA